MFADTHNMVTYLSNSDASEGFDQIVNFLNAHTIKYALVVNPTIYVSCIKQFWATATVKKVNDVVQLCALIEGKKVVVSKAIIRRDLHLDDAEGVECLPNEEIFEELARMGYEKPPSTLTFYKACSMESAVICLATGRKFNFSKYIFDSMVRNVDSPSMFLMYPHFLQVVLDNQMADMITHNTRYTSYALTQKVFANMRRVGKGFSGVETPLFASMMVQLQPQAEEEVKIPIALAPPSTASAHSLTDLQDPTPTPHATPPQDQPSTPHDSPPYEQQTTSHESSIPLLTTLMETCATLSQKVTELERDKYSQALKMHPNRGKIEAIDADEGFILVDVEKDEEVVDMDVESQRRGMTYDKVRPIFEREYKKVQTLFKPDKDVQEPKKKRVADETLLQENFKKLRAAEVLGSKSTKEIPSNNPKEMTEEDVQSMLEIVPVPEFKVEAFTEKFSSAVPSEDKEKALWVELKMLFEPDADDVLWKLHRYMHAPLTWKLYTNFMILMLSGKLQVEEDNEMARDLVMKIFMEANKLKSRSLDTSLN
nr:hypothetical protein [Tanacetum cinerariifolium]